MTDYKSFLGDLEEFYSQGARDLPWREPDTRGRINPYHVLVSEFMLQQTQVNRVIPKYQSFLVAFPTIADLAGAELAQVLQVWVGLGYNRRARFLWEAAQALADKPKPWHPDMLAALRGIGPNTAAAVVAYSHDEPVVFIETNIRTVMIHHFFVGSSDVSDAEIRQKLTEVLPWRNDRKGVLCSPRHFYWALMDYGTVLKSTVGNHNRRSRSYTKQSTFQGSRRQLRGALIRLLAGGPMSVESVRKVLPDNRLDEVIAALAAERLVSLQDKTLMLYNER